MSDGEKWRRAEAYIEREIEFHQRAIDAGGMGFDALRDRMLKRDTYKAILDRAEGRTMADKCEWREDEDGWWWTGCDAGYPIGNWEVELPTPEGSGDKFCPECGGKIVGIGYLESDVPKNP